MSVWAPQATQTTPADPAEAIAIIEDCRQTHVEWAEWQEATPDWRAHVDADAPGGPEHHREWVRKYDRVLDVLKGIA